MSMIETREPFRDEYVPDRVVARDETISELGYIFSDFVTGNRSQPPYLFITGDGGTGKRTVTKNILDQVEQEIGKGINILTVDCGQHNSPYQIYIELAYQICENDYPSGTHQLDLEEAIFQQMGSQDGTWYLILENLEQIQNANFPFADLHQAISEFGTNDLRCGVIGISDSTGLHDHLSGEVLHKPYMYTLEFNPYNAAQLRQIIEYHAEIVFNDNSLSDAVVPKCAAIVAQETGSATEALQLLELSSYVAYQEGVDKVTETHVQTATESLSVLKTYLTFTQDLTPKQQLLCTIVAIHTISDEIPNTTRTIFEMYQEHCESFQLDTVSKRRVEQLLGDLRRKNLVYSEGHNIGRAGGTWTTHELAIPPYEIFQAATATTTRYARLLQNHDSPVDPPEISDGKVSIDAFLSNDWP